MRIEKTLIPSRSIETYICEVCGNRSGNEDEIIECEAQHKCQHVKWSYSVEPNEHAGERYALIRHCVYCDKEESMPIGQEHLARLWINPGRTVGREGTVIQNSEGVTQTEIECTCGRGPYNPPESHALGCLFRNKQ